MSKTAESSDRPNKRSRGKAPTEHEFAKVISTFELAHKNRGVASAELDHLSQFGRDDKGDMVGDAEIRTRLTSTSEEYARVRAETKAFLLKALVRQDDQSAQDVLLTGHTNDGCMRYSLMQLSTQALAALLTDLIDVYRDQHREIASIASGKSTHTA